MHFRGAAMIDWKPFESKLNQWNLRQQLLQVILQTRCTSAGSGQPLHTLPIVNYTSLFLLLTPLLVLLLPSLIRRKLAGFWPCLQPSWSPWILLLLSVVTLSFTTVGSKFHCVSPYGYQKVGNLCFHAQRYCKNCLWCYVAFFPAFAGGSN